MKSIFSQSGLQALSSLKSTKTLYAFDFDGTLAPIVTEPTHANAGSTTLQYLDALSRLGSTAVISGRALQDLKKRFTFHPKYLIGNHGLEGLPNEPDLMHLKQVCAHWVEQLLHEPLLAGGTGCFLEDKGYSLSIHYRVSRSRKSREDLMILVTKLKPEPRVVFGKSVINLIPSGGPHKGVALLELMRLDGAEYAIYLGDDDTDEDMANDET